MNIIKNKSIQLALATALIIPVNIAFADHPVEIVNAKDTHIMSKITSLRTKVKENSIVVFGKLKRSQRGFKSKSGKVKIELFNAKGQLFKTVKVTQKRHRHHVNMPFKFSSKIYLKSHDLISKVVVTKL